MSNKFGVFVHLDYAHQPVNECKLIWQRIMGTMSDYNFSFKKRCFVICTEMSRDEISIEVRRILEDINSESTNLYSYISDCFILDLKDCTDLTFPDTSDSIDVEDISIEEMDVLAKTHKLSFGRK